MQFCELMYEGFADYINIDVYPDGCCQKDVYICNGDGEEIYIPPFTYHGFRYCYVYGITEEQATKDLITYIVLRNDVEVRGEFSCSDEISNSIFDACRRIPCTFGLLRWCNFNGSVHYGGMYVKCNRRKRRG